MKKPKFMFDNNENDKHVCVICEKSLPDNVSHYGAYESNKTNGFRICKTCVDNIVYMSNCSSTYKDLMASEYNKG